MSYAWALDWDPNRDEEPSLEVLHGWLALAVQRRAELDARLCRLMDNNDSQARRFDASFDDVESEWFCILETLVRINQRLDRALRIVPPSQS